MNIGRYTEPEEIAAHLRWNQKITISRHNPRCQSWWPGTKIIPQLLTLEKYGLIVVRKRKRGAWSTLTAMGTKVWHVLQESTKEE